MTLNFYIFYLNVCLLLITNKEKSYLSYLLNLVILYNTKIITLNYITCSLELLSLIEFSSTLRSLTF